MLALRKALVALAAAAVVATGLTAAGPATRAEAAVPTTIPLDVKNNSGRADKVYIYDLGQDQAPHRSWAGPRPTARSTPGRPAATRRPPRPTRPLPAPANGGSTTNCIPEVSGWIDFSYGQKLVFTLATGGLVQPAVQNPSDPNREHPVQLVGVHARRHRPVHQQHPG